jgi:hypothetical protein
MPDHHLIDRRALDVAEQSVPEYLNTIEMAVWLRCSRRWLEIGRHRGYGPPYSKMGSRVVYERDAVRAWLRERAHLSTAEYETGGRGRPRKVVAEAGEP